MIIFSTLLLFVYIITLAVLLFGYYKINNFELKDNHPTIQFSIIIPFRNEATHLPDLLNSIDELNYPKELFEFIFVDDESTDQSVSIIKNDSSFKNYQIIKNLRISSSPKKDAITEAIKIAKFDWIVTTDADCILPKNWLEILNQFILKNNPEMIAGPVRYKKTKGLVNDYQQLDNFSLQTVTIGGFGINNQLICNGANLAYRKDLFYELSGFSGNQNLASGDDIFLMEKFKKRNKNGVQFLKNKDAVISTATENYWRDIINQRIRWASKTSRQKNKATQFIGLVVFMVNFFCILGLLYSIYNPSFLKFYIGFLITKFGMDLIFNSPSVYFSNYKIRFSNYLASAFIYTFITVLVVFKSLSGSYNWKGRTFKK